ncbi:hypothetical protein MAP00_000592 [Monascus purpureus]|nr:hypothetical protein MAP00_000592 [Monascus purpureus]
MLLPRSLQVTALAQALVTCHPHPLTSFPASASSRLLFSLLPPFYLFLLPLSISWSDPSLSITPINPTNSPNPSKPPLSSGPFRYS